MKVSALVSAALLAGGCAAPVADARSRPPADPNAVAGSWTLTVEGRPTCRLRLSVTPSAHGHRAVPEGCSAPIAQWRPVPDGLELAGADGLTLILLEPAGAYAYAGRDAARRPARLSR